MINRNFWEQLIDKWTVPKEKTDMFILPENVISTKTSIWEELEGLDDLLDDL